MSDEVCISQVCQQLEPQAVKIEKPRLLIAFSYSFTKGFHGLSLPVAVADTEVTNGTFPRMYQVFRRNGGDLDEQWQVIWEVRTPFLTLLSCDLAFKLLSQC